MKESPYHLHSICQRKIAILPSICHFAGSERPKSYFLSAFAVCAWKRPIYAAIAASNVIALPADMFQSTPKVIMVPCLGYFKGVMTARFFTVFARVCALLEGDYGDILIRVRRRSGNSGNGRSIYDWQI